MAVVPGLSISELINAAGVCKDIISGFTDKYGNSTSRVRNLATNITALCAGLEQYQAALEENGSCFEGYESFKLTLQECNEFIKKYQVLLTHKRSHPATWWPTAMYTFEGQNVAQLQAQITSQMNLMHMSFYVTSRRLSRINSESVSALQSSCETADRELPEKSVARSMSPRRDSARRSSLVAGIDRLAPSAMDPCSQDIPSSNSSYRSVRRPSQAASTISSASHSIGEVCEVTIEGSRKRFKLDRLPVIHKHDRAWDIVILSDKKRPILKHHIHAPYSESCHPYTEHAIWNKPFCVTFEDPVISRQSLTLPQKKTTDENIPGKVTWAFKVPQDDSDPSEFAYLESLFFDFQSIIYGKVLLDIYNIQSVYSSRQRESSKQQLKIWSDPITCPSPNSYITFFANNETDKRHLEFPISWFDKELECKDQMVVHVNFRSKSKMKKADTFQAQATNNASLFGRRVSTAPSMETKYTLASSTSSDPSDLSEAPYQQLDLTVGVLKMKYLKITFTTTAGLFFKFSVAPISLTNPFPKLLVNLTSIIADT